MIYEPAGADDGRISQLYDGGVSEVLVTGRPTNPAGEGRENIRRRLPDIKAAISSCVAAGGLNVSAGG